MRAMVLRAPRTRLELSEMPVPKPIGHQVLLNVSACGVCRTDLHIAEGELEHPKLPLVLGHEIVARVVENGPEAARFTPGDRVGVPWLGGVDGTCRECRRQRENLCDNAVFTGYSVNGGYADYAVADEDFCLSIPTPYGDTEAAPLLCAGLIGYRTYRMVGDAAEHIGIYGFGAAAHVITQVAVHQGRKIYAFTRPGDRQAQEFALGLGATWAGGSDELPPAHLDAALLFAPVGALIPLALKATAKGGVVVSGGIHMSDIPSFPYRLLWEERVIRSVANLTRQDGAEFMALAASFRIQTTITPFALEDANTALDRLRAGEIDGAAVLRGTP
jgi:propanol-preferring alcohol dehydrogenase